MGDVQKPYTVSFLFPLSNRDGTKGEQVSQNGLPSDQESPRVSYRSQTYQNYKNFISRRTANDRSWSGLWPTESLAATETFFQYGLLVLV